MTLNARLETIIRPVVEGLGFELWGIEFRPSGKASFLRIFIDSDQGINVEDCAQVSRQVSAVMDVEDPISEKYSLEVSSPGLDRPLFKLGQYANYIGQELRVALLVPLGKRRKLKAKLEGVDGNKLILSLDNGDSCQLPFHQVRHAHLVYSL